MKNTRDRRSSFIQPSLIGIMFSSSVRVLKNRSLLLARSERSHQCYRLVSRSALSSTSSQFESPTYPSSSWARGWIVVLGAAAGTAAVLRNSEETQTTTCSGILGVVGTSGSSRDYFAQGLTVLGKRGFDGVGIVGIDENIGLVLSKHAVVDDTGDTKSPGEDPILSLVDQHFTYHSLKTTAMAHTRWATMGGKTNESNVHPHVDASGKIALIHNGTLTNARDLKEELQELGYVFEGQTDSEVIAKLIGHYYANGEGRSVKEATNQALRRCDGTWGLCILCADAPDELVVACNGSPLFIGLGDDRIYVASEVSAFSWYTKNYIMMKDGEIGVLHADGRTLDLSRKEESKEDDEKESLPTPFDHWTLKEIMEQPNAVGRALCFGARLSWEKVFLGGLDRNAELLGKIQHLVLAGCGSSLHAARYGERLMKHISSVPGRVTSTDAAESDVTDLASSGDSSTTGLVAISQSGETTDVKRFVTAATDEGATTIGVVNVVGSLVARAAKMGVYCHAGQENGVASTKTFTSQVTVLAMIALWFRELRDRLEGNGVPSVETERLKEALLRLPLSLGMALGTRDRCKKVAKRLQKKEHCFVLGKGKIMGSSFHSLLPSNSSYFNYQQQASRSRLLLKEL